MLKDACDILRKKMEEMQTRQSLWSDIHQVNRDTDTHALAAASENDGAEFECL